MLRRTIPTTDVKVSVLGMGCARLGSIGVHKNKKQTGRLIAAAVDHGITTFDTSSSYAQGRSEILLGQGLQDSQHLHDAVIITKIGYLPSWGPRGFKLGMKAYYKLSAKIGLGAANRQCFEPQFLRRSVERSLTRLRRDHIDVLMLHSPPAAIIGVDDLRTLLQSMQGEGKIRTFGFSSLTLAPEHLAQAMNYPVIGTRPIPSIIDQLKAHSTGVFAYETFNSLPEKTDDYGATLRQTVNHAGVTSVVVGMSSVRHIEYNTAALTPLSEVNYDSTQQNT